MLALVPLTLWAQDNTWEINEEEEVKKYSEEKNIPFKLTSAKNPMSFNKFLEDLVKKYLEKRGAGSGGTKDKIDLNNKKRNNDKKKFC
jgi:hypothetical protein